MMFLLRRIAHALLVMLGISVVMFAVFYATPGADPSARLAGKGASPALLAQIRHQYGFDQSLLEQYARMMYRIFVQRQVMSYVNHGQNVVSQIVSAAPVTLSLVGVASIMVVIGCLVLGVGSAMLGEGRIGVALVYFMLVMVATPVFWLGEIVNMVTQGRWHDMWFLRWVPGLGYTPFTLSPWGWLLSLLLPAWTLSISFIGFYARMLRGELLLAMRSPAIRTAWAKGASPAHVWLCHGLRLSLTGVITLFGMDFAQLVGGGALLVEVVFALPGIGHLTYEALNSFDLPLLMTVVMYSALLITITHALVDGLLIWLDPRLRDRKTV